MLDRALAAFACDYRDGFGGSMENALDAVHRLAAVFADAAPCLSPTRHRSLAGSAARRIVVCVDRCGWRDGEPPGQLARQIVAETVKADRDAFDRGVRGPSRRHS
jgi:hypothetical protein